MAIAVEPPSPVRADAARKTRDGLFAAVLAYFIWGLFPFMFRALDGIDPVTIVAHRILWSIPVIAIFLAINGRMGEVATALRDKRLVATIALAALFLLVNWLVYVWSVESRRVLETSFGYFVMPLISVVLGMVLLGERQNPTQWVAIGLAVLAVIIQAVGVGGVPIVALAIAFSFAIYGFIRKTVSVGSAPGLMIETLLLLPIAVGYLIYGFVTHGPGLQADPAKFAWLVFTGPATAAALVLFAFATRQLRLTTIGFIQYLAPSMQFLIAVFVFHEPINATRVASFGLIWLSLIVFSGDSWRRRGIVAG